jgi:hypothetical protein
MSNQHVRPKPHTAVTSIKGDINSTNTQAVPIRCADEIHDSPRQLAERWGLSPECIRNLFRDEVGILVILRPEKLRKKRIYTTLRIPRSVSHRVHCQLQSK